MIKTIQFIAVLLLVTLTASLSATAATKPLKIFILAGQSNMEGQAKVETFDYIGDDPKTAPMLKEMRGPDGKLTPSEFPRGDIFKQMDKNQDGTVTLDEAKALYGGRRRPSNPEI